MPQAPHLILIAPPHSADSKPPSLCDAWKAAIKEYFGDGSQQFSVIEGKLGDIDPNLLQCECMVSPANCFGIMNGGYDMELSRVFMGDEGDIMRLSQHVQASLRARWAGYAPPSSCTLVPLPSDVSGPTKNPWGASVLAVLPTMRFPESVAWHRDLVYNSMWSLLAEISLWNRSSKPINRVLMTGLGTGVGEIGAEVCARQMVLAVKHWTQPVLHKPDWEDVLPRVNEVEDTLGTKGSTLR